MRTFRGSAPPLASVVENVVSGEACGAVSSVVAVGFGLGGSLRLFPSPSWMGERVGPAPAPRLASSRHCLGPQMLALTP